MVALLEIFYDMTVRVSGSYYVTSNNFFTEISDLHCMLSEVQNAFDLSLQSMGLNMKAKFDKYWGDLEKTNTLIFISIILDPRDKLEYMEFSLK